MSSPATSAGTAWILWGAMCLALINYVIVASAITRHPDAASPYLPLLTVGFLAVAAINTACSLLLAPLLGRRMRSYWVYLVARLLFAESVALLGLVLYLLGADMPVFLGFAGVTLALLLLSLPTARDREQFLRRL
ncbi:MAG: hypothetical protein JNL82_10820 [Myxococcales bacterium]|nr:hypothetical protein [Myxococcales bacterium]